MQKAHIVLAALLTITSLGYCQNKNSSIVIQGLVVDSISRESLELVTVALLKANRDVIKFTSTDSKGHFTFSYEGGGVVLIRCSYVGYKDSVYRRLEIRGTQDIDVGKILLPQSLQKLDEVTVTATKILIEDKGDKLVYNASSDISNKSGSATDVMKKVPLLSVSADGEVQMRGSSNIKVLLNGRPSSVLSKNLKRALKTIPATSIQSIEVITSPSSKYEAEGASGVINIITKEKPQQTQANVDISGGNLTQSGSGMLNVAHKKFNINLSASVNSDKMRTISSVDRTSLDEGEQTGNLIQRADMVQKDRGASSDVTVEYTPDSTQELGATITYWRGSWPSSSQLYNRYESSGQITEYNQHSQQSGVFNWLDGSLNYRKKFKQKGRELLMLGQYSKSRDNAQYITRQYTISGVNYFTEQSPNEGSGTDLSAQTDYSHPFGKKQSYVLETGLRYAKSNSSSNFSVLNNRNSPGGELVDDPERANKMDYYQDVFAAYASLKLETVSKWSFRIGTRYEGTRLGGKFEDNTPAFKSSFDNLVPSLLVDKKLNDRQNVKFSYTTRIRRPWIWDLNPYVNASDPRNITSGNPQLRPETTRMFEAGHSYTGQLGTLSSSIFFNVNSNAIESLRVVDSLGISRSTPRNIASNKRIGTNINAFLMLSEAWSVNTGLEVLYVSYTSKGLSTQNDGTIFSVNVNSSYELPHGFTIQANGNYDNGRIMLQGKTSYSYSYQFSAQKELMNKKLIVSFATTNPFQRRFAQQSYASSPTFNSITDTYFYNRSFSLTLSYNLGMIDSGKGKNSTYDKNERMPFRR